MSLFSSPPKIPNILPVATEPDPGTHPVEGTDVTFPARDLRSNRGGADVPTVPGPSFARGLWRIAAADVSSGNHVTLLRDGPATFAAMLQIIEEATTSVDLES